MTALPACFKAYDIRGRVPDELNADLAYRTGQATAKYLGAKRIAVGRDCRLSSADLADAVTRGLRSAGCDVLDIGLQSTRVRTRDNRMVVVPNSIIGENIVVNHSDPSTMYRVQTHVGVGYGTDVAYARQVMVDAVRAQDWVMKDEPIEALFLEFGESALVFRVRCWIENYVETRRIMDKLNTCLYEALNEAGIDMPDPTRTLYHRVDPADRDGLVAVLREARE